MIKKKKDDTLKSGKKKRIAREEIINAFKNGIFLYMHGFQVETNEELHTTDMSELESKEYAVQRKNQKTK